MSISLSLHCIVWKLSWFQFYRSFAAIDCYSNLSQWTASFLWSLIGSWWSGCWCTAPITAIILNNDENCAPMRLLLHDGFGVNNAAPSACADIILRKHRCSIISARCCCVNASNCWIDWVMAINRCKTSSAIKSKLGTEDTFYLGRRWI